MKRPLFALAVLLLLVSAVGCADGGGIGDDTGIGRVTDSTGCAHSWETLAFEAPTCTADGAASYRCRRCGKLVSQTFTAEGHRWGSFCRICRD